MAKYNIGQKLLLNKGGSDELVPVVITGWRGGGVAPYEIKCLDGKSTWRYASARDMIAFEEQHKIEGRFLTADEKIDLLLKHFGLKIEVEPQVVKVVKDEETSD